MFRSLSWNPFFFKIFNIFKILLLWIYIFYFFNNNIWASIIWLLLRLLLLLLLLLGRTLLGRISNWSWDGVLWGIASRHIGLWAEGLWGEGLWGVGLRSICLWHKWLGSIVDWVGLRSNSWSDKRLLDHGLSVNDGLLLNDNRLLNGLSRLGNKLISNSNFYLLVNDLSLYWIVFNSFLKSINWDILFFV